MLSLGSFSFLAPWALSAFVLLPVLWWLLRLTPPAPRRLAFPPIRLLLALKTQEESAARTPLWLLILRILLIISLILGLAHPLLNAATDLRGTGPVILVVDDGWASAQNWPGRRAMMLRYIDQAERDNRPVILMTSASVDAATPPPPVAMMSASDARATAEPMLPKPWQTDRKALLKRLLGAAALTGKPPGHVVWLSDGLDDGETESFVIELDHLGTLTVAIDSPRRQATVLRPPKSEGSQLRIRAARSYSAAGTLWVRVTGDDGRLLTRQPIHFKSNEPAAEATFQLPSELRNKMARLEIEGQTTAGGVVLIDERWRRRPVGVVGGSGADQPLLSDLYYLERALEPFTEVRLGSVRDLMARELAVLVLSDPPILEPAASKTLTDWVEKGGVVLRFAGPALARKSGDLAADDPLLPVKLRRGDRIMGGAMSWERPATLAPFAESSPFFGLAVPRDVRVGRQVLAQPAVGLADQTWAQLIDGTPLVTAAKQGDGWVILVHTTANTTWSNLPLSGLFVDMLRRIIGLSQGVVAKPGGPPLRPLKVLDGFGQLNPPLPEVLSIPGVAFDKTVPGPAHPPGLYGDPVQRRALNLTEHVADPQPLIIDPDFATIEQYGASREVDLRPWLLGLALLLALLDMTASMALRGLFLRRQTLAAVLLVLASATAASAQSGEGSALAASLETRLAYVITGDGAIDEVSRAGLSGLSLVVKNRTAAELGDPVGVNLVEDDLVFYPLLYWPLSEGQAMPSAATAAKIVEYLQAGGTILFDSRDNDGTTAFMRELARRLNIPPLQPIGPNHVLTRTFYLMREFPGRWTGDTLWVERAGERINDGVSPVIAGSHDWAAAWALGENGQPMFPVVPGGPRQRELAYRFGINLVMYTLTGNYKGDQVHVPAIIERLGQ